MNIHSHTSRRNKDEDLPELTRLLFRVRKLDQRAQNLFNNPRALIHMVRKYLPIQNTKASAQSHPLVHNPQTKTTHTPDQRKRIQSQAPHRTRPKRLQHDIILLPLDTIPIAPAIHHKERANRDIHRLDNDRVRHRDALRVDEGVDPGQNGRDRLERLT